MALGTIGAIIGAGVLGAGASVAAGSMAAGAASDAAAQSAQAATNAAKLQTDEARRQYDQTRADYTPYRAVGTGALSKLAAMYGVGDGVDWEAYVKADPLAYQDWLSNYPDMSLSDYGKYNYTYDLNYHRGTGQFSQAQAQEQTIETPYGTFTIPGTQAKAMAAAPDANPNYAGRDLSKFKNNGGFQASPGYDWRMTEGTKAIERSAASRGLLRSGGTLKAIQRYGEGLASSEYENYANRLASLAGVGQSATGSTSAAGQAASAGIQAAYGAAGNAQANAFTNAGNARASSYQNIGNAVGGLAGNVAGAYLYGQGMKTPWNAGMPGVAV